LAVEIYDLLTIQYTVGNEEETWELT